MPDGKESEVGLFLPELRLRIRQVDGTVPVLQGMEHICRRESDGFKIRIRNKVTDTVKQIAAKALDEVIKRIAQKTKEFVLGIQKKLVSPEVKEKNVDAVKEVARTSIIEKLKQKKIEAAEYNAQRDHRPKTKSGREER